MTEEEIISGLQHENEQALNELIDRYTAYVSTIIYRIIGGKAEDCKELTADVFIAAWINKEKLQKGKVKAYLGEIARNKSFNFLRSSKSFLPLDEEIIFDNCIPRESPEEYAESREAAAVLKKALSQLSEGKKELFLRYYYYGQKLKDAADDMNINLSTAKVWLKRGRDTLKEILEKQGIN